MEIPTILDKLIIRHAHSTDLPALEWNGEFKHFRKLYAETFQRSLNNLAIMWVSEISDHGIIGQLFIQLSSSRLEVADGSTRAYIYAFRVKPAFRSQGIGKRMLQIAERDLFERGFHWVVLNVAQDNLKAQKLYKRTGYKIIGPDPGIWSYQDENGLTHYVEEPAWRMEKDLLKARLDNL
jgi:ribosomal protein S18 acetylase RimI-like enzyme